MKFILLIATAIALANFIQFAQARGCTNCHRPSHGPKYNDRFLSYGMYGLAFPGAGYPIEGGTYAGAYGLGIESPFFGMGLGGKGVDIGKGAIDVAQGKGGKGVEVAVGGGLIVQEFTPTLLGYPGTQGPYSYGVSATQGLGSLHNPILVGNQAQYGPLSGAEIFGIDPFYGPGAGFGLGAWGYRGSPAYDFVNSATDVYGYPDVLENVPINVLQQQVNPIALTNAQYVSEIYPTLAPFGGYGWTAFN